MPYIALSTRKKYNGIIADLNAMLADKATSELNYVITRLLNEFISERGLCYTTINEAIGVLECAKLELYRRIAGPYEEIKRRQNTDVYYIGGKSNGGI